ncbi:MAG: hypothetical protein WC047_06950 [Kiritimatiellales bacterium]
MFKKLLLLTAVILSSLSLSTQATWWSNDDITMLVMPREVIPLQIAQDIARRYPVLLVSYQITQNDLKLHAWNGDSWVAVSAEDYTNGTFFANRPKHAIIVESERLRAPEVLVPSSTWCETANRLTSTDPRVMIHLLGVYFDFPFRHWDQLAKRYGYSIEQINPTLLNVHWWNLRGDVLLEKRAQRNFSVDLNNWYYLETIPAPVIEPVIMEEEAPVTEPAVPEKTESDATDVAITAKAPVVPPEVEPPAAPAVEPVAVLEPAPMVERSVEPQSEIPVVIEADPFTTEEIPAAEIVVPQKPKKHWWKFF